MRRSSVDETEEQKLTIEKCRVVGSSLFEGSIPSCMAFVQRYRILVVEVGFLSKHAEAREIYIFNKDAAIFRCKDGEWNSDCCRRGGGCGYVSAVNGTREMELRTRDPEDDPPELAEIFHPRC
jgi:hypothetical protein